MTNSNLIIKLYNLATHPLISFIALIIGILGIIVSYYIYKKSKKSRELHYYIAPTRSIIVKTGQASGLSISYEGQEITTDITAAHISFWNEGTEPIKKENILEPIEVITSPPAQILEVSTSKISRDLTEFHAEPAESRTGVISVSWKILEQNDTASIQTIYAGPPRNRNHNERYYRRTKRYYL
jgi:hypothetical protein